MAGHTWLEAIKQGVVVTKAGIRCRMGRLGPEKKLYIWEEKDLEGRP